MKVFGLKTCDTCRKTMKSLPDAVFVDVRSEGVPHEVLKQALAKFGDALVNVRSTTWRGLDLEARQLPHLELLKTYPTLMKRPLVVTESSLTLGWSKDVQATLGVA